jgi:hypothetical protein
MEKIIYNNEVFEFTPMMYNEKHLVKVNLNWDGLLGGEGIWAVISEEDFKKYEEDEKNGKFVFMLANDSIHLSPNRSWGLHLVAEFRGVNRPVCNLSLMDFSNRVLSPDVSYEIKGLEWKQPLGQEEYDRLRDELFNG